MKDSRRVFYNDVQNSVGLLITPSHLRLLFVVLRSLALFYMCKVCSHSSFGTSTRTWKLRISANFLYIDILWFVIVISTHFTTHSSIGHFLLGWISSHIIDVSLENIAYISRFPFCRLERIFPRQDPIGCHAGISIKTDAILSRFLLSLQQVFGKKLVLYSLEILMERIAKTDTALLNCFLTYYHVFQWLSCAFSLFEPKKCQC